MDNKRLLLFAALFMTLFMIWTSWQTEHPPAPRANAGSTSTGAVPANDVPSVTGPKNATKSDAAPAVEEFFARGERIEIVTDLLQVTVDTNGGDLRDLRLRKHPVAVDKPEIPFRLMGDEGDIFIAQSGLIGEGDNYPTHRSRFSTPQLRYALSDGVSELRVPLSFVGADGVRYTKTYIFRRGSYAVDIEFAVVNGSKREWKGFLYGQFQRSFLNSHSMFTATSYTGPALYTPANKYEKVSFDDIKSTPLKRDTTDAWVAMLQHYFVGVWLPMKDEHLSIYGSAVNPLLFRVGYQQLEPTTVAAGTSGVLRARLYAGPKEHVRLEHLACAAADLSPKGCDDNERVHAPLVEQSVDYGRLRVIAAPLFSLLRWIHQLIGNWGWSIVALTILVKLAFYPLSAMSYKSMAKMRKVAPKMEALKQQHANDRTQLNQAMMELYKTEKVNPFGGCLPILIQIPVFIALYSVLLESVEMRQAPWMLWIHDLSSKDPFYVLPIIMGATMYLQQRLSPQPPDPMQRKMFLFMPLIFTVMMMYFPAGLVLYWTVNNGLSILQQWRINTLIDGKKTK